MFRPRVPVLALLCFGAALAGPGLSGAQAANGDFVVTDDSGYGISECMKPGMDCGRVIADAWCEAHGHGHASAYALGDDVTGATKVSTGPAAPAAPPGSVIIHCGE